jgi:hypothetical protein
MSPMKARVAGIVVKTRKLMALFVFVLGAQLTASALDNGLAGAATPPTWNPTG